MTPFSALRRAAALLLPIALVAGALTVVAVVAPGSQDPAEASTSSSFQAGNIISDAEFANTASMTAAQIQAFLDAKVPTCTAGYTCLRNYTQTTTTRAKDTYCAGYTGRAGQSAATIVSLVATSCGINPQVILVTLQKEEGLVLSTRPTSGLYTTAMGYGCPDTSACQSTYFGFFNQVYSAAHQFQVYAQNPTYFRYRAGYTNVIQYSPSASCGSASVYIQNQATASLYNYTPYTPNAAALAAGYGSATCGAYGNRNFFLYFTDWFGNPANWFKSASFEGRSTSGWTWSAGFINRQAVTNAAQAEDGSSFLATNTPVKGRAVTQTVSRTTKVGEQATATVWLRSASSAGFSGKLRLWGLGGTQEFATTAFSVGTKWTAYTVALPVRASSHSQIRLDIYENQVGSTLWVDNTSLTFGAAPVLTNALANPGFEGTFAGWTPGNGAMNRQVYESTKAQSGSWFAAANTPVAGRSFSQTVPVFGDSTTGYDFTIWLRSSTSTPFSGTVALWGLGGSAQTRGAVNYTVGSTWKKITVSLDPGSTAPKTVKAEVYMTTLQSKGTLWLDSASLQRNVLSNGSFESGTAGWAASSTAQTLTTGTTTALGAKAETGTSAAIVTTKTAGTSVSQTVAAAPQIGDSYTATVWVRSTTATPVSGRLAAWALGGTTEGASQKFTATTTWTKVTFSLPTKVAGHTSLRLEVYEDTVGQKLELDGARLS